MTVLLYGSAETESTTSLVAWQDKLSDSGMLNGGEYFIWVYAEYGGSITTEGVAARVLIDDVERGYDSFIPQVAGQYKAFSVFGRLTVSVSEWEEESHSITIQYVSADVSQTAKIRRVRFMIERE